MRHISKMLLIEYNKLAEPESMKDDPIFAKYARYPLRKRIRISRFLLFLLTQSKRPDELVPVNYGMKNYYRKDYYEKTVKLKYEDGEYDAPGAYREVLTTIYGDYMTPPPEDKRGGHELSMGTIIWDLQRDYSEYQ